MYENDLTKSSVFNLIGAFSALFVRSTIFAVLLILIPIGLPLLILVSYCVRSLIASIAFAYFGKSLGKLVSARGVCCAQDDMYEKPQNNIVVSLKFTGHVEIEELRELVRLRLLQAYLPGAQLKYPELQQHLFSFCGYYFWKNCEMIDLNNHVKELKLPPQDSTTLKESLSEIIQICVNKQWKKEEPLWEMQLVHLNGDQQESEHEEFILLFTMHHCLGDGYAILGLLRNDLCRTEAVDHVQPQRTERNRTKFLYILYSWFKVSWDMSEVVKHCVVPSLWRPKSPEKHQTWNILGRKLSFADVKLIKARLGVSFSSVLTAAISGAIRNEIIHDNGERLQALNTNHCRIWCLRPMPLPGRGPKLRNFMSESLTCLPVNDFTPLERLRKSNEIFETSRTDPSEIFVSVIFVTMGLLPNFLCRFLLHHMPASTIISNFPGGPEDGCMLTLSGVKLKCTEALFTMGLTVPTIGLGVTMLTYGDSLQLTLVANQGLYSRMQAETLLNGIYIELDALSSLVT